MKPTILKTLYGTIAACAFCAIWLAARFGLFSEVGESTQNIVHGRSECRESVRQCLDRLGLELSKAVYLEEPPGHLSAIKIYSHDGGWYEIRLAASELYSDSENWDRLAVLSSKVAEVMDDKTLHRIHVRILENEEKENNQSR